MWKRRFDVGKTIALVAMLVAICPAGARAALLGVTADGEVWKIDESTGALERVGATGNQYEGAIAVDSLGIVHGAAGVAFQGWLLETIDPLTGIATLGAKLQPSAIVRSMAFSSDDVLYAVDDSNMLLRIDVTSGAVTTVGRLAAGGQFSLASGPDGLLYAINGFDFGTVDLDTGRFTRLLTFDLHLTSFAFLPSGKIVGGVSAGLYELDPATGSSREIARLDRDFNFAFLPDLPEPPPPTSLGPTSAFKVADFDGTLTSRFVTLGNVAYFQSSSPTDGTAIWRTDGTAAGTQHLKIVAPGYGCCPSFEPVVNVGGTLYFTAFEPATGDELWKSDGTTAGTQLVVDLVPGSAGSNPFELTASGGKLFFAAIAPNGGGPYLFRSDGTAEGTQQQLSTSAPASFMWEPRDLTDVDGTLYFNSYDPINERHPAWKTDGTPEGTLQVDAVPDEPTKVDGTLFYVRSSLVDGSLVAELWKSVGSITTLVKEFPIQRDTVGIGSLTDVNGTLFFFAGDSPGFSSVWTSDGTPEGTQRVTSPPSPNPGPGLLAQGPAAVGGTFFFSAEDSASGRELWKSDGTSSGTRLVKDIQAGAGSSTPSSLADVGGELAFSACDDATGCEPWITSPTYPGAVRVADIAPGPAHSNPSDFTRLGDLVLFHVHRGSIYETGWELWAIPISALSLECSDGIDDDGDGLIDFDGGASANGGVALGSPDPGCYDGSLISAESQPCQDGVDDDGDGGIDFDGGASANHGVALGDPDPECTQPWRNTERPAPCGLGVELAVAMPLLEMLRRRMRRA